MNDEAKPSESEGSSLHLGKFAPSQPPPPTDPADEGQTVFFRRTAAEVTQQGAQPVVAPKQGNAIPPKEMLGAVAYCYAKGVYSSAEIEGRMLRDPALREATHDEIPDANTIRRFRRLNRDAILRTLEKWYRKLRKARPSAAPPPAPARREFNEEPTTIVARREATDRLDKAAFIDNMEKD